MLGLENDMMRLDLRFFAAVALLCGLALPTVTLGQDSPEYETQLELGRAALKDGDYPRAVVAFEAASHFGGSRQRESWGTLGWLYTKLEEPVQALRAYQELFALAPGQSIEHLRLLTEAYRRAGRVSETLEPCREFIRLASDDALRAYGHNELGYWLLENDSAGSANLEDAQVSFQEALTLSGGQANNSRLNLAEVLVRQGLDEASRQLVDSLVSESQAKSWRGLRLTDLNEVVSTHADQVERELRRVSQPTQTHSAQGVEPAGSPPGGLPGPVHVGGEVRKPEKISAPQPQYTEEARKAKIQGVVIAQAIIDIEGRVGSVRILKGLPHGLSESAIETLKTWRFRPATLEGEPVAVYYNLTMNFRLE